MDIYRKRISYFYEDTIGNYYYGSGHPMKPNRVRMTDCLVKKFGLYNKMEVYCPYALSASEMVKFHDSEYIDFLENVNIDNQEYYKLQFSSFLGKLYSGGSVSGASKLNHRESDIVINWAGGFHHAKKSQAAGFCYVNDIVLAIMELLKFHSRVMYVDIDVHHGDGVEEAFYCSNRVLTVSFHKGKNFFPGTGDVEDIGTREGKYFAINFPLEEGVSDDTFFSAFKPIIDRSMERFRPEAIVLQCGADSLTGDRLGCFNLTCEGHGRCVEYVCNAGLPILVLGGGGYTIRNVARCWAYETAICLKEELPNLIPPHEFMDCYAPDFRLHLPPAELEDANTQQYLEETTAKLIETINCIPIAPSVFGFSDQELFKENLTDDKCKTVKNECNKDAGMFILNIAADKPEEFVDNKEM